MTRALGEWIWLVWNFCYDIFPVKFCRWLLSAKRFGGKGWADWVHIEAIGGRRACDFLLFFVFFHFAFDILCRWPFPLAEYTEATWFSIWKCWQFFFFRLGVYAKWKRCCRNERWAYFQYQNYVEWDLSAKMLKFILLKIKCSFENI